MLLQSMKRLYPQHKGHPQSWTAHARPATKFVKCFQSYKCRCKRRNPNTFVIISDLSRSAWQQQEISVLEVANQELATSLQVNFNTALS